MKGSTTVSLQAQAGLRGHGLQVGQAIAVKRGVLAGMSGVLLGFNRNHRCLIELDVVQPGVMLVIDRASVKERPASAFGEHPATRAAEARGKQPISFGPPADRSHNA